jgi:ketosteroid isomerase-like protein
MQESQTDVIRGIYDAFNRRDIDGVLDGMHPEVEVVETQDLAYAATLLRVLGPRFVVLSAGYRGHEEVKKLFEAVWTLADWFIAEPQEFVEGDDWVVVVLRLRARAKGTGLEGEAETAHLWGTRDGKGARLEVYTDKDQALKAAAESP